MCPGADTHAAGPWRSNAFPVEGENALRPFLGRHRVELLITLDGLAVGAALMAAVGSESGLVRDVGLAVVIGAAVGGVVSIAHTESDFRRQTDLRRAALRQARSALDVVIATPVYGRADSPGTADLGRWTIGRLAEAAERGELEQHLFGTQHGTSGGTMGRVRSTKEIEILNSQMFVLYIGLNATKGLSAAIVTFGSSVGASMSDLPEEARREVQRAQTALMRAREALGALTPAGCKLIHAHWSADTEAKHVRASMAGVLAEFGDAVREVAAARARLSDMTRLEAV